MERTPEHIDDIFRKRMYDVAPPPPAFVWENVERELRKRKRRVFFWIFSVGIACASLIGIWLTNGFRNGQLATSTINQQAPVLPAEKQSTVSSTTSMETPAYSTTVAAEESTGTAYAQKTRTTTTPIGKRAALINTSVKVAPIHQNKTASHQPTSGQPLTETTPATLEAKPQKAIFEGETPATAVKPVVQQTMDQPLPASKREMVQHADTVQKSGSQGLNTLAAKPEALAKKPVKNCYDFARQPNAWLFDVYAGPALAQRELVSSPDNQPYLNKRLSTEHRGLAYNAGVRASVMLKGNFLIRTGVNYDHITEVFEYIDPEYVKYLVEIVNQNGMTTIDTVGVEYGEKYQKTYNRFGMLDIPLSAGFELRKGRSGININAGMSINVLFWKRGAIVSPEYGTPAWFTPDNGTLEVFRPRTGLSASASVQWFYHLQPRLRVFVEPYFKKMLRPVTVSSHPVEQRYGIAGLRLGLTQILN